MLNRGENLSSLDLAVGPLSPSSRPSQPCRGLHRVILTCQRWGCTLQSHFPCWKGGDLSRRDTPPWPSALWAGRGVQGLALLPNTHQGMVKGDASSALSPPLFPSPCSTSNREDRSRAGFGVLPQCLQMMPASDRTETLNTSPLAFLSTKHKTNVEVVNTVQEHKPNSLCAASSQEVEWPDGPGTPQLREGPCASFLWSPATAPPPHAGHRQDLRARCRQNSLSCSTTALCSQGWANTGRRRQDRKGSTSKRKEASLHQPSATGHREVTEAAPSAAGGGGPAATTLRCSSTPAPVTPVDCPISHPRDHPGTETVVQSSSSHSL